MLLYIINHAFYLSFFLLLLGRGLRVFNQKPAADGPGVPEHMDLALISAMLTLPEPSNSVGACTCKYQDLLSLLYLSVVVVVVVVVVLVVVVVVVVVVLDLPLLRFQIEN